MSAADYLDEYFESDVIKGHLSGSSVIGTALGPRSPGSAYVLLHHYMVDAPHYKGEGELWAEFYIKRELIWQKRRVRCKVVPRPFFAPERRKLTPPLDR